MPLLPELVSPKSGRGLVDTRPSVRSSSDEGIGIDLTRTPFSVDISKHRGSIQI